MATNKNLSNILGQFFSLSSGHLEDVFVKIVLKLNDLLIRTDPMQIGTTHRVRTILGEHQTIPHLEQVHHV